MRGTSEEMDRFLTMVIGQHGMWKLHLHRAAEGHPVPLVPETARLDDRCDLGKWLHGGTDGVLDAAERREIIELHARFHRVAATSLEHGLAGRRAEARSALEPGSEFLEISTGLVERLHARRGRSYRTDHLTDPHTVSQQLAGTLIEGGAQAQMTLDGAEKVAEHANAVAAATEEQRAVAADVATRVSEVASSMEGITGNAQFIANATDDGLALATWLEEYTAGQLSTTA